VGKGAAGGGDKVHAATASRTRFGYKFSFMLFQAHLRSELSACPWARACEDDKSVLEKGGFRGRTNSRQRTLLFQWAQSGVSFHIACDDECKVYLNGRIVYRSNHDRDYVLDEEKVGGGLDCGGPFLRGRRRPMR
jgi:hypothetical protein